MSCALISAQVGIVLNSIEMMEPIRCGRRKQRNPRRKNGRFDFFHCFTFVFISFYSLGYETLLYMEEKWRLRELIREFLPSTT